MVTLESATRRYIGLSSDDKPVPGEIDHTGNELSEADLPAGSSFLESDTNRIFRWNGNEWVHADTPEVLQLKAITSLLSAMNERLTRNSF